MYMHYMAVAPTCRMFTTNSYILETYTCIIKFFNLQFIGSHTYRE